jgi:EAL domain-containing protein (putative c-di-GMP-specific phosphodiesterase class I)
MGYWAIEEACRHLERLEREFPNERMHLSVNVSPRQLNQVDFVERLEEIFVKYSFRSGGLWLELTESSLMDDHKKVAAKMNRIQAMGILIALDDFGTGYSSLSMLLDIPLDCLKIDRSFVLQLGKSENSEELVRMILKLSEMLGLSVVAEGIETEENAQILRSMGCRWGQGYLYSKPVPIDEFIDRIGVNKKAA